jgi:hypothetical protein
MNYIRMLKAVSFNFKNNSTCGMKIKDEFSSACAFAGYVELSSRKSGTSANELKGSTI